LKQTSKNLFLCFSFFSALSKLPLLYTTFTNLIWHFRCHHRNSKITLRRHSLRSIHQFPTIQRRLRSNKRHKFVPIFRFDFTSTIQKCAFNRSGPRENRSTHWRGSTCEVVPGFYAYWSKYQASSCGTVFYFLRLFFILIKYPTTQTKVYKLASIQYSFVDFLPYYNFNFYSFLF
jgi:hypothetical protein